MKIKETIERDCCDPNKDLVDYKGDVYDDYDGKLKYCKHCGQLWVLSYTTDASIGVETVWKKLLPGSCELER